MPKPLAPIPTCCRSCSKPRPRNPNPVWTEWAPLPPEWEPHIGRRTGYLGLYVELTCSHECRKGDRQ